MAKFVIQQPILAVTCGQSAVVSDISDGSCEALSIPAQHAQTLKENKNKPSDSNGDASSSAVQIVAGDISVSRNYMVLCTNNKLVTLWKRCSPTWTVVSSRICARIASKVKFVPSEKDFLLADKSGDVHQFSVTSPHEAGQILFGHLTMILDILVTPDEQYVITCDRDEKIRVTCYPNTYNINSYCLGHKEFVTSILLLPHDSTVLVSQSGDGTMKFWDYVTGIEVYTINTCGDVSSHCIKTEENNAEGNPLPIRKAIACKNNISASLVCCSISNVNGCLVYEVNGNKKNITHTVVQYIQLPVEPWDIHCIDTQLWVTAPISGRPICVFVWDSTTQQFLDCREPRILSTVENINSKWEMFEKLDSNNPSLDLFFKRRFDNVQVYQERKKQRLAAKSVFSCTNVSVQ